ncbi:MAG: hypothetical protein V4543_03355 [Bacteroidota bacterium]
MKALCKVISLISPIMPTALHQNNIPDELKPGDIAPETEAAAEQVDMVAPHYPWNNNQLDIIALANDMFKDAYYLPAEFEEAMYKAEKASRSSTPMFPWME